MAEMRKHCSPHGFIFRVFGSEPGAVVFEEHYPK